MFEKMTYRSLPYPKQALYEDDNNHKYIHKTHWRWDKHLKEQFNNVVVKVTVITDPTINIHEIIILSAAYVVWGDIGQEKAEGNIPVSHYTDASFLSRDVEERIK